MSLLIEALKQAEARKGPKPGKPAEGSADARPDEQKAGDASGQAAEPEASAARAPAEATSGLELSLAPREDGAPASAPAAAVEPAPQASVEPARPAAAAASEPAASPTPTPTPPAQASAPKAAETPTARTPTPAPQPTPAPAAPAPRNEASASGRLQTGSEAARRTAREVMAAAQTRSQPPRRWRMLLAALLVVAVLLSAGLWWLTLQTGSGIGPQLANVPPVSEEVLAEASRDSHPAPFEDAAPSPEATVAPTELSVPAQTAGAAAGSDPTPPPSDHSAQASEAAGASTAAPSAAQSTTAAPPRPATISAPATPLRPTPTLRIERARQAQQPMLSAYAALNRGELALARRDYQRALQLHPGHPDALLGLAVIAEREGDLDSAARRYREVLQADPRNPTALAALLGSGAGGEARSESQLREALAAQPRSASLHFALGNRLAAAQRWPEAQQAYFDAAVLAPDDPDLMFNLGVALDRLHKPQLALEHYLRAEELRRARPANYDPNALARRITSLSQQLGAGGDRPR